MPHDSIKIIRPSKEIYSIVDNYKQIVKTALPNCRITLVGSFGVPMCGKEEFDLLVETDDICSAQKLISEHSGGKIGVGPIKDGVAYCRSKKRFGMICELHIIPFGHSKKDKCLRQIEKLKKNPILLGKYEDLKYSLEGKSEEIYKKEKLKFLESHGLI